MHGCERTMAGMLVRRKTFMGGWDKPDREDWDKTYNKLQNLLYICIISFKDVFLHTDIDGVQ